jgi:dienelactone hydrolase
MKVASMVIALILLTPPAAPTPPDPVVPTDGGVASTDVTFVGDGGITLHGSVLAPTTPGRHAAVVMLQGAGNRSWSERKPEAEALARHGLVVLAYDKRTIGYSLLHRDYRVLAEDAVAAVRLLAGRSDVDNTRVGLWALSEGAFVAPLAAASSTQIRFLITVGAAAMTPAVQTIWAYGENFAHAGVSGSFPHTLQVPASQLARDAGLFPEADFDPVPEWRRVRQPVLAQWGVLDRQVAPAESAAALERALREGGNDQVTIRIVPDARHDLNHTSDDGFDRDSDLLPDFGDFEAGWIERLGTGPVPAHVGPAAQQDRPTRPTTDPSWYGRARTQLVVAILMLGGFFAHLAIVVAGRYRRPRVRLPRATAWLAGSGLVTFAGLLGYLFFTLASAANVLGPVLFGRPVPWLMLQLAALGIVVGAVVTVVRAWPAVRGGWRRLLPLGGALGLFLPWALHWGLLTP